MCNGGLKTIATAYSRYLQVERSVLWMAAIFHEVFLCLLRASDLGQDALDVALSKMSAKSALPVFNM